MDFQAEKSSEVQQGDLLPKKIQNSFVRKLFLRINEKVVSDGTKEASGTVPIQRLSGTTYKFFITSRES